MPTLLSRCLPAFRAVALPLRAALLCALLPALAAAQSAAGTVSGRILNPATGEYVRNAQIRVEGTNLLAVSEDGGLYSLPGVPAGPARLSVTFTGYRTETAGVQVPAGGTAVRDFDLVSSLAAAPAKQRSPSCSSLPRQQRQGHACWPSAASSGPDARRDAGLAQLREMDKQKGYDKLEENGQLFEEVVLETLRKKGLGYRWYRKGSMFCLFFTEREVHDLHDAKTADLEAFRKFFHYCLEHGVYFAPSQFETGFMSLAHSPDDILQTAEVAAAALASL
jgi:hypothetical protein